jgi:hypothetical protein
LELDTGVAQGRLPITWNHTRVDQQPKIQWLLATLHKTGWVDDCPVCHGSFTAIPVLAHVEVGMVYCYSASHHYYLQWHVWSHRWHDATFSREEDTIEGRLNLCREECAAAAGKLW